MHVKCTRDAVWSREKYMSGATKHKERQLTLRRPDADRLEALGHLHRQHDRFNELLDLLVQPSDIAAIKQPYFRCLRRTITRRDLAQTCAHHRTRSNTARANL